MQERPEQQPPHAPPQSWPAPTHDGVTFVHVPPRQSPEQHSESFVHDWPGNEQDTKSSHVPCALQMAGKQHSPLSLHASPPPLHRPELIERTHLDTPPEGKHVMPGQQPAPSLAELKHFSP